MQQRLKRKIFTSDVIKVNIHKVVQQFVYIRDLLLDYRIGLHPTSDFISIIFVNLHGDYEFKIMVLSKNSIITIEVSELRSGVYGLLILIGEVFQVKNLIKDRLGYRDEIIFYLINY